MLHNRERWIQFHQLTICPEPIEAPNIKLSDCIANLATHIESGQAFQLKNNDKASFRIKDYSLIDNHGNGKYLALLFHYADQDATDPVFADLQTGKLRHEPKLDGEGVAVSAHALIDLTPLPDDEFTHRFLLEIVPGLGRSNVSPFIKKQFKDANEGSFEYIDQASSSRKQYKPSIDLLGVPSSTFIEELERGQLAGIEFIKRVKSNEALDEDGYFFEEKHIMKVKLHKVISKKSIGEESIEKLRMMALRKGYDELKIRYKKKEGKQKSVLMGTSAEDIADILVIKDEKIVTDEDLLQCSPEIDSNFLSKMLSLIPR